MTTETPDSKKVSNAAVSMSQPLLSSRARIPSSRYTARGPPPWKRTGTSRPIAAEGTISVSTGRPGRE